MASSLHTSGGLIFKLINASAGNFQQYQITFWAQLLLGFLYSFGYFQSNIAGIVLGFFMPVLWIVLIYRYIRIRHKENIELPFPIWMRKNPGNSLIIIGDVLFLGAVWALIVSGFYNPAWLKALFTMVFPILTLSMLRSLVIYPIPVQEDDKANEDLDQVGN
jgi:hypothetical protein